MSEKGRVRVVRCYGWRVTASEVLRRQFRILLALMLGVVLLQTAPAGDLPVQRGHGSAFSATTYDVALPVRRDAAKIAGLAPMPTMAVLPQAPSELRAYDLRAEASLGRPRQTGPPVRPPRLDTASPRGPPTIS